VKNFGGKTGLGNAQGKMLKKLKEKKLGREAGVRVGLREEVCKVGRDESIVQRRRLEEKQG
jgi:hypothetical protein